MTAVPPLPSPAVLGFPERVAVDRAFDAGRAAWGDVGLERDDFRARVAQRAARCGGTADEGRADEASEWIHAAALVDLYLASACEAGNARAWEILTRDMRPRLEGFAARRGGPSSRSGERRGLRVVQYRRSRVRATFRASGRGFYDEGDHVGSRSVV